MRATKSAREKAGEPLATDKLFMESTLLRVAGALFCHDPKRAAKRTEQIELNRGIVEKHIVIRPDPKLGQPGQLAHKIFVALIKKHSNYGKPIQNEISFTKREIMRLIGRKKWGGRDSEQLSRALHEIHYSFVTTHFKDSDGRLLEHSFNIFPEILIERREFASDPIEACTITLAQPIVQSLKDEHFTCLNHALMQELGTIGQAFYMRLFFHFANLYTGVNRSRLTFQKQYQDICVEWLGGLSILAHKSKIIGEQLGSHLDQLVEMGFLASYEISEAKGKVRGGFILTFYPGTCFFADYDRFYRRRQQGELRWDFRADQRQTGEPLKLAHLFNEKRTGRPVASIAYVSSKDVETAKQFLTEISFEEAPAFLDFAMAAARETNFDVQTLGGLRQYLARYKAREETQKAVRDETAARREKEDERLAYDRYRRLEIAAIFASLPTDERTTIEELAARAAATFRGSLRDTMLSTKRSQITAQRHGDRIKSFDDWRLTH
jgi:hypothetical protein